ncbi:hypothetical protein HRG_005617 [Hirsutella rhossiliensis]|uniref:Uncharacterized protein n=1 Tax=Hirsutella rhossiliensis TaxID=111463 RepID=A0A9P8MXF3_9HYPO|nr:uncharacterized protein HRG_05617 [Hirsutella rhossiliensis]KAH0963107.1 hypothetical protein HRG_05617 [Hirsutella rhossiliensis]
MPSLKQRLLTLALPLAAAAAALPGATPSSGPAPAPAPAPPAATTPAPPAEVSMPATCDYSYCDGTSSWCFYWGGVTSYDVDRGPVPGEIRAPLGPCAAPRRTPSATPPPAPAHTRAA